MDKRIQKWDLLKAFLMFCVVLGHFADVHTGTSEFAQSLYLLLYTFHMPLFIFISGLFSKKMVNEKQWDKMLGYLVLYFFLKLVKFIYDAVFDQCFTFRVFGETGIAWFMFALFAFAVITVFTSKYKPACVLVFSILLSLFAGYDNEIGSTFVLSRIIVLYPFYYAGYCIDPKKLVKVSKGKIKKLVAIVLIGVLIWVAFTFKDLYITRPMFVCQHPYEKLNEYAAFGPLIRLACYAVSALACVCFIIITPNKIGKGFLARFGQYTLPVYCFHYLIIYLVYRTFKITDYVTEDTMMWLIFLLSLFTTLLLSNKWLNILVVKLMEIPKKTRRAMPREAKKE